MSGDLRYVVGGCVYRSLVHVRHMGSVLQLIAANAGGFRGLRYIHTSNLPAGRVSWLRACIADKGIDRAISVDSDSEFDGAQLNDVMHVPPESIAIGCVPFVIGGTGNKININDINGMRMSLSDVRYLRSDYEVIESGGFGVAVFNLDWFRSHLPEPTTEGDQSFGEDICMCRLVGKHGGKIAVLRVSSVHHHLVAAESQAISFKKV